MRDEARERGLLAGMGRMVGILDNSWLECFKRTCDLGLVHGIRGPHGPILMAYHRRWMALKKESQGKIERFNPTFALFDEHRRFIVTVIVT